MRGVSHSEYIRRENGEFVFLETSARVGGAHLAELVEAATGLNLWAEWARIEESRRQAAIRRAARAGRSTRGCIVSLARQEQPALDDYADPEVVWRLDKGHHAGLIVRSPSGRVSRLLRSYGERFARDFVAALPPRTTPSD